VGFVSERLAGITDSMVTCESQVYQYPWYTQGGELPCECDAIGQLVVRVATDRGRFVETSQCRTPLFDLDEEISADRRIAWLCRIDLLREMGRFTEVLAWACLECELHPDSAAARAVKDELKRLTRFGRRRGESPSLDRTPPWSDGRDSPACDSCACS
jgi:hypothetical protein